MAETSSPRDIDALFDRIDEAFADMARIYADHDFMNRITGFLLPDAGRCTKLQWDEVEEIERCMDAHLLTDEDYDLIADACALVQGVDKSTGQRMYFAPMAANIITTRTVRYAIAAKELLWRCGLHARTVVCGYEIHPDAVPAIESENALVYTRERPR